MNNTDQKSSSAPGNGAGKVALRLYIAGHAPNSMEAMRNLYNLFKICGPDHFLLEIVDVLADPPRARAEGIRVTPALVRLSPGPQVKLFGSLEDTQQVIQVLGPEEISRERRNGSQ